MSDVAEENVEVVPEIIYLAYDNDGNEIKVDSDQGICYATIELQDNNNMDEDNPTPSDGEKCTVSNGDIVTFYPQLYVCVEDKDKPDTSEDVTLSEANEICDISVADAESGLNYYTCKVCQMTYLCINCLSFHYETTHVQPGDIVCKAASCGRRRRNKDYVCSVCDMIFYETDDEVLEKTEEINCETCGASFHDQAVYARHIRTAHILYLVCKKCPSKFMYEHKLVTHYKIIHNINMCVKCEETFEDDVTLQEHLREHKHKDCAIRDIAMILPYACNKCGKGFATVHEVASHLRISHPNKVMMRRLENGKSKGVPHPVKATK